MASTAYDGQGEIEERLNRFEKEMKSVSKISGVRKGKTLLEELAVMDPNSLRALEAHDGNYFINQYPAVLAAQTDRNYFHLMKQLMR